MCFHALLGTLSSYTVCYCCHLLVFSLTSCKLTVACACCLVFTYLAICAATCLYCTLSNAILCSNTSNVPLLQLLTVKLQQKGTSHFWLPQKSSCIGIINKINQWMTDNCLSIILASQIVLNYMEKSEISAVLYIFDCPSEPSSSNSIPIVSETVFLTWHDLHFLPTTARSKLWSWQTLCPGSHCKHSTWDNSLFHWCKWSNSTETNESMWVQKLCYIKSESTAKKNPKAIFFLTRYTCLTSCPAVCVAMPFNQDRYVQYHFRAEVL